MTEPKPVTPAAGVTQGEAAQVMPVAQLKHPRARTWPAYILPLLAAALTIWAAVVQWSKKGLSIEITFPHAHGLKPGNPLRYRGVVAGEVQNLVLKQDLSGIKTTVRLFPGNENLARAGSVFWIVRPQLGMSGIQGLDTVIGARYIAVRPGKGKPQTRFEGLARQRTYTSSKPGDLDLVLVANHARNLNEGASISYRGIVVGSILSVRLGPSGRTVEASARIYRPYTELIRPDTVFWNIKPIKMNANLWNFILPWLETRLEVGKPKTFLFGGIALAVPTDSREQTVANGHQFKLREKPPKDVEDWKPLLRIGSKFLPEKIKLPCQTKVKVTWVEKAFFGRKYPKARTGWLTLVGKVLWGPANLFPRDQKYLYTGKIELEGESIPLRTVAITRPPNNPKLLFIEPSLSLKHLFLPRNCPVLRPVKEIKAKDCVLVTGRDSEQPISKTQMKLVKEDDQNILALKDLAPLGPIFHGAAAFARDNGALLGLLVIEKDKMNIYPVNTEDVKTQCVVQTKCHKATQKDVLINCATTCLSQCCKDVTSPQCLYPPQRKKCMNTCLKQCSQKHSDTICQPITVCKPAQAKQPTRRKAPPRR